VWSHLRAVNLLKEHALDNHGIKHIVVKGSTVEDSMGKCPDNDMLDSIDKEHKDPKNTSAEQLYPTSLDSSKAIYHRHNRCQLFHYDKRSETSRTNCDLCGKQFEQQTTSLSISTFSWIQNFGH
jgi:hypothetical protein